jgi:phosphoglycolate phosphatase-like HAD superfamily hydrolase
VRLHSSPERIKGSATDETPFRLERYRLVFWDFDGVIKESVDVKTDAFSELFAPYGEEVRQRIVAYHLANGGLSRHIKIAHALKHFVGIEPTGDAVEAMAARFGDLVREKVVEAPWVPGAEALLRSNPYGQRFVLVTGTPETEVVWILERLRLDAVFNEVYGAPTTKADAVRESLTRHEIKPEDCVFLGDSRTDLEAARAYGVTFVLRETADASEQFVDYSGVRVRDLKEVA